MNRTADPVAEPFYFVIRKLLQRIQMYSTNGYLFY